MKPSSSPLTTHKFKWLLLGFALAFGVLLVSTPAFAQATKNKSFQVQQFRPWGDPDGMFMTQSGKTAGHLNYMVGFMFNYARDPLVSRNLNGTRDVSIIDNQLALDIYGSIGFFEFLEVGLVIPMTLYQTGKVPDYPFFAPFQNNDLTGFAFSDIKLQVKAQALRQEKHWLNLGFRAFVGFPTGGKDNFNGEDGISFGVAMMANRWFAKKVNVALNFGYRYLPPTDFATLIIQHELTYSLGLGIRVVDKYFDVIAEIGGATALSENTALNAAPLDVYLGGRIYPLGRMDLAINIGVGMGAFYAGYGSPLFRVFAGLTWAPRIYDTDKDGIFDNVDKCPKVPGPKENNGCPWGDKDNDGLKDNVDKCPSTPGPKANKGCPWGDRDGDGLKDNEDKCPDKPGPRANNGCPWGDKDGDGLKDNVDKCPNVAGPKANNGCPWGDRDNDGVKDNVDKCPNTAGLAEFKGCPDSDKDKIPNPEDKCPFVPGVANTKDPSKHGCPKVVLVKVTGTEIKILQRIYFRTGSAKIRLRSYRVLDQVVQVLQSRPKIRIMIEGHTDDVGSARSNLRLSNRRAASVRAYLNKKGIDSSRLESKGFGESKPLVGGPRRFTRSQRAKNRRVQFKILK